MDELEEASARRKGRLEARTPELGARAVGLQTVGPRIILPGRDPREIERAFERPARLVAFGGGAAEFRLGHDDRGEIL